MPWSDAAKVCTVSVEEGRRAVIELEDIAYVRSGVADLPAAVRFATDV